MTPSSRRAALRAALPVALVAAAALGLTGCTPPNPSSRTPSATAGGASGGPTAAPAPAVSPTPTDPPTPVAIKCDALVTTDQLYAFNPNYGVDPNYAPKSGTHEKQIADWKGTTCAWLNQSSGAKIEIAVAKPPASLLEGLKNAAITEAKPVPTYGTPPDVEGYFKPGTSGEVQIFRGPYWIVADSTAFFEPGDAAPLMQDVLGNVPAS
ncbi:iron ABC transporter ATP-binding protein [Leifsonia sp. AG29]|uniref:iron ABC transporter ATP-binding protein n=1 Tax=Leifsonia sp. AG29 TaxID=2598860 RepID=UPI00131D1F02|nr:iron ABC transporter ATP-binding protein [Leifsonia sp. AG29]